MINRNMSQKTKINSEKIGKTFNKDEQLYVIYTCFQKETLSKRMKKVVTIKISEILFNRGIEKLFLDLFKIYLFH